MRLMCGLKISLAHQGGFDYVDQEPFGTPSRTPMTSSPKVLSGCYRNYTDDGYSGIYLSGLTASVSVRINDWIGYKSQGTCATFICFRLLQSSLPIHLVQVKAYQRAAIAGYCRLMSI